MTGLELVKLLKSAARDCKVNAETERDYAVSVYWQGKHEGLNFAALLLEWWLQEAESTASVDSRVEAPEGAQP